MSVILYARVSTGQQAEKELSIPAQLRALRHYAAERRWEIADEFQDVSSGCSLQQRHGLVSALRLATHDKRVEAVIVHKVDRLSRNTYQYLTIKGQLRAHGVNIVSVVEHFEANPMGEFIEHIMAAQAEFYSANLSFEVKKGLEERRQQGKWSGPLPLGYVNERGRVRLDPARASHVRYAFERWATGKVTSTALADDLYEHGLVGAHGKRLSASRICRLLQNPFYIGIMRTATGEHPGLHPHLVDRALFVRCQEVFVQKGKRGKGRKYLCFVLTGLLHCPRCDANLVGEQHTKKSGKIYRYYRCHRQACSFNIRAERLEDDARQGVLALRVDAVLLPVLQKRLRAARQKGDERHAADVRGLRKRARDLDDEQRRLAKRMAEGIIAADEFDRQRREVQETQNVVRWMLARSEHTTAVDPQLLEYIELLRGLEHALNGNDVVEQRRVLRGLLLRVDLRDRVELTLKDHWRRMLDGVQQHRSPIREVASACV